MKKFPQCMSIPSRNSISCMWIRFNSIIVIIKTTVSIQYGDWIILMSGVQWIYTNVSIYTPTKHNWSKIYAQLLTQRFSVILIIQNINDRCEITTQRRLVTLMSKTQTFCHLTAASQLVGSVGEKTTNHSNCYSVQLL